MPNIRLVLEYNGSAFSGWQKQPGQRTIQSELERVLKIVLPVGIGSLHAAGRTDAGVHARAQVVNFFCESLPDLSRLTHSVSSLLKNEVSIVGADIVPDNFHACRDSKKKQYSYLILHRKAPAVLSRGRAWHITSELDIPKMQSEAIALVGEHDFTSFRGAGCQNRTPIKTIFESVLEKDGEHIVYRVVGSGFLKQMVRNIVGTLVAFGKGTTEIGGMRELLALKDRTQAGITAPAHGLCLDWVEY